jgi:multimeric flavodoxin WrbA
MKVLILNGSPKAKGNTAFAIGEFAKVLENDGIETEIINIGSKAIRGCAACGRCSELGKCVFDDAVNEIAEKFEQADGLVVASPVYYASPSGEVIAFLDRFFGAGSQVLRHKPAAAIASARRAGTTATLDVLNKYLQYSEMPLVTTNYWPMVHGNVPSEVMQDNEGIQTMHVLGKNMAWILKCIEAGKKAGVEEPEKVDKIKTNFIR